MYAVSQTAVWRSCMREGIVFKQCSGDNVCVADGSMEKLQWGRMMFKQCSGDDVCVADGSMEKLHWGRMVFKQCSGDDVHDACVSDSSIEKMYWGRDDVHAVFRR